jgi:hypothetical protein
MTLIEESELLCLQPKMRNVQRLVRMRASEGKASNVDEGSRLSFAGSEAEDEAILEQLELATQKRIPTRPKSRHLAFFASRLCSETQANGPNTRWHRRAMRVWRLVSSLETYRSQNCFKPAGSLRTIWPTPGHLSLAIDRTCLQGRSTRRRCLYELNEGTVGEWSGRSSLSYSLI